MLPRPRTGDHRPAAVGEVVCERVLGEPARSLDAADHVELPAGDPGACCGPGRGQRGQGGPTAVPQHVDRGPRDRARPVAADDVQLAPAAHRHRVVDAGRQAGKPPPAVAGRRVRVGAARVLAVRPEAADDADLTAEDRGGDLGARQRHRSSRPPARRGGAREAAAQRNGQDTNGERTPHAAKIAGTGCPGHRAMPHLASDPYA